MQVIALEDRLQLMVFTDLDGTLLDHDHYGYSGAMPALEALKILGAPLILATSKTAAEIAPLHRALGLGPWPAIVENGAALSVPGGPDPDDADYRSIRSSLDTLPGELRQPFHGFGDMSAEDVAAVTGLSPRSAALAKVRCHTEPGIWDGTDEAKAHFLAALDAAGIAARQGGRFLTLSFGKTKADQMRGLIAEYRPEKTVALGDAPNDVEMIETADLGVIIRNDHGPGIPRLPGEQTGRICRSAEPGPVGWNREVLAILSELGRHEGKE